MPFGSCNAPATFERLIERVLGVLIWESCLVYLNDVIVHGKTFEENAERLNKVTEMLAKAGFQPSPKKCHLFKRQVAFL